MFDRFLGRDQAPAPADQPAPVIDGETETVRRIVARLDALPLDQARLLASAAYTLARAAHADLHITDDELKLMEKLLQERTGLDEATTVLVVEMAKLQTLTIGGREDYSVTREFHELANHEQRVALLRACYAIGAANDDISAEENATVNQIAKELQLSDDEVKAIRSEFHDRLSVVKAQQRLLGRDPSA